MSEQTVDSFTFGDSTKQMNNAIGRKV